MQRLRLHAHAAARRLRRRPGRRRRHGLDRRDHGRVRRADARERREHVLAAARRAAVRAGQFSDLERRRGRRPPRRTAAATAGTASRRSTSRPCTAWRPRRTSSTTARRAASTTTCSPAGQVVSDNKASIVTNSWGEPTFVVVDGELFDDRPGLVTPTRASSSRAPSQGIGFYFSSGDDGDDSRLGLQAPDYPSGDPWVTAVGGTSLAIDKDNTRLRDRLGHHEVRAHGKRQGLGAAGPVPDGAGGGISEIFKRPWYQDGVVPSSAKGRAVPDIAPRRATRRPACWSARRRTSLPSRGRGPLRRVPPRRHEPLLAADRGRAGRRAGPGAASASPTRASTSSREIGQRRRSAVLRRHAAGRRRATSAPTTPTGSTATTATSSRSGRSTRTRPRRPARAGTTSPVSAPSRRSTSTRSPGAGSQVHCTRGRARTLGARPR